MIGEKIRCIREDKDIRQQDLADSVGINVSVLSRIEKGTRPVRTDELMAIAKKLQVSADYLLDDEIQPSAPRLKALRLDKGLSQSECAEALGIDRTTYAKYENGGSVKRHIENLANFFDVSTDYLLGRSDERKRGLSDEAALKLGERLKELRATKPGLTQARFAEIMNVSQQAVNSWEAARTSPAIDLLIRIADYYGITVDALLGHEKNESPLSNSIPENRNFPKHGDIFRHFKNKLYEVLECPVQHTETGEQMVVYRALYGGYGVYCRSLGMFMSEVDHEKYPDIKQKYRFELIERGGDK